MLGLDGMRERLKVFLLLVMLLTIALIGVHLFLTPAASPVRQQVEVVMRRPCMRQFNCDHNARLYTEEGHSFLAADDLPEEGLAPLTQRVQRFIWQHQHRSEEECARARYLRHSTGFGLGAQMQRAGVVLADAIEQGSIFMWDEHAGQAYAVPSLCPGTPNWLCFLQPPTNCSEAHATPNNTIRASEAVLTSNVPKVVKGWLSEEAPHLNYRGIKMWWRAQSVAYLLRMNKSTVEALASLRKAERMVRMVSAPKSELVTRWLKSKPQPVFPLPPGTISMHVRHGEKAKEMTLVPYHKYQEAAVHLATMQYLSLHKTVFVSTEDPAVIKELRTNTTEGWVALYSDFLRNNTDGRLQMRMAKDMAYLHLLQLLMALECDAWVGTRNSNWALIIDQLRCVWVAKCRNPFHEVGLPQDWQHIISI